MKTRSLNNLLSVFCPLVLALAIYIIYRPIDVGVNKLGSILFGLSSYDEFVHPLVQAFPLSDFIVYALPGGLWVYSLTVASKFQSLRLKRVVIDLSILPIVYALGLELCQYLGITDGRFDPLDIIAYIFAWLLATNNQIAFEHYPRLGLNGHTAFLIFGYAILCLANLY